MIDLSLETTRAHHRQIVDRAAGIDLRLRHLAAEDPNVFMPYVFRDAKTCAPITQSRMHRIWHQLVDRYNRLILLGHVNSGKSIQIAQGRVLYELGRNPNLRIGVCCATQKRALRITAAIGEHIESNERLHAVFPNLRMQSKVWSPAGFFVQRSSQATDPSVVAIGLHSGILGARLDLLILDDVLDLDNTRTEHTRKMTSEWVISTLFGRLDLGARVILIGNAFHPEDLLHQLEKQPDWASFRFPVLDAAGKSTWDEKWPLDAIAAKRIEFGELEFARQMMCQARADGEAHFRQAWFDAAKARGANIDAPEQIGSVPRDCLSVSSVDLGVKVHANGSLSSISSSIWSEYDGKASLNRVTTGKWAAPQIVENIIDHQRRFKSIVVVEDNGSQDFLISQLRQAAPNILVRTHYTGNNKYHPTFGVIGLAPEFERGDWTIPSRSSQGRPGVSKDVEALIQDMLYYNPTNHLPDRLSSFWIGNHYARKKLLRQAGTIEFDALAR